VHSEIGICNMAGINHHFSTLLNSASDVTAKAHLLSVASSESGNVAWCSSILGFPLNKTFYLMLALNVPLHINNDS